MKRSSWFPILLVTVLVGLLALLGGLQYKWLGKISDDERERMQKRLETDTERFAEDFNRRIQNAYFLFQLEAKIWRDRDYAPFNERYDGWRNNAKYPSLITDIYFMRGDELLRFEPQQRTFTTAQWTDELKSKKDEFAAGNIEPVDEKNLLLVMPIYESMNRILARGERSPDEEEEARLRIPEKYGYLVIKLDEATIKNQIFPELAEKYFSDGSNADFRVSVINRENEREVVFATAESSSEIAGQKADASASLLNLSPEQFSVFVNRELLSTIRGEQQSIRQSKVYVNRTFENHLKKDVVKIMPSPPSTTPQSSSSSSNERVSIFSIKRSNGDPNPLILPKSRDESGKWLLNVRHADGSLESFIAKTRRKNLAVSFGILSLLAISIGLIFVSAQRAKRLAQKQMDFVSAVSHEFRTPLAVIYSAGENLNDGVVNNPAQIEKYGSLIKREGKKLSSMVEQILEFAGARSGKRKFDFRPIEVSKIIETALAECEPLLREKGFTVEKDIQENLPPVLADENALTQAIQNLIANAVKYCGGSDWLKISARNGGGKVKISVEDKGIGIAAKDLKHVFEPFYRAKEVVDEQIHGNGLGLSLVKQTIEAHGAKVEVTSELRKGSRFTIYLPSNI